MCFFWFGFDACFAVWGDFGRCFGMHLGRLGPLKIMPKCTTVYIFRVWTLLVRRRFRDLLLEGVWHAFCEIWVPIGGPIGATCGHFCQLLQGLILQSVLGRQKRAKSMRKRGAGGRGGACLTMQILQEWYPDSITPCSPCGDAANNRASPVPPTPGEHRVT